MDTIKHHAMNSLKWSALASGFGVTLVASLLLSSWIAFQVMVFLVQR